MDVLGSKDGSPDQRGTADQCEKRPLTFIRSFDVPNVRSLVSSESGNELFLLNNKEIQSFVPDTGDCITIFKSQHDFLYPGLKIIVVNGYLGLWWSRKDDLRIIPTNPGNASNSYTNVPCRIDPWQRDVYNTDVAYADNKLVLTYHPTKKEFPTRACVKDLLTGSLIDVKPKGLLNFSSPTHVCTAKEEGRYFAYIVDEGRSIRSNMVTKISMDGEVVGAFNDWNIQSTGPITATGDGRVFMLCKEKRAIRVLPPPSLFENQQLVLGIFLDDPEYITNIHFNQNTSNLFIATKNKVHIFGVDLTAIPR